MGAASFPRADSSGSDAAASAAGSSETNGGDALDGDEARLDLLRQVEDEHDLALAGGVDLPIEPAKAEYRALAEHPALRGRLRVYSVGADSALPLRLNPFVPAGSVPLSRHIDLLKAVFNAAFPMFAGMSYVLEEAMLEVYTERGWNLHASANDLLGPHPSPDDLHALMPSIGDLHNKIEQVLERKRYGQEVHQNMGAALRSRLQSLIVGTKGMALDTRRSVPVEELLENPCVIELRNLGDDEEKSFVMALLLCQLYEYAESRSSGGGERLRHLTLVEEAHRLLRAARPPSDAETPDAQAKAVAMFTDMLAELRAYGEGFIVADQIPTKLTPETIKNSNLKILHRLSAADDRAVVGGAANLTERQIRHLATLAPGEAVVHDEQIGSAVLVGMRALTAEPLPAEETARPSFEPDRSYLHRNGACRRCPSPCSFLHLISGRAQRDDQALRPLWSALLVGDAETAWSLWASWRGEEGDPGRLYCAASQAAFRWLGEVGGRPAEPAQRLRQDRAARRVAACATRGSSVSSRRRELEKLTATLLPHLPEPPAELLYCLVVNATADHPTATTEQARAHTDARVAELLTALCEGETGR